MEDFKNEFLPYLSSDLANAMTPSVNSLTGKIGDKEFTVVYFSVAKRAADSLDKAFSKIAKDLEAVHAKYTILGSLSFCGKIDLNISELTVPTGIFSFVAIPTDRLEEFNKEYLPTRQTEGVSPVDIATLED